MKRLLSTIALLLASGSALLADHPNEARGFAADRAYSFHDVDTVNAYNGNMVIRIPIGPEYKVNGSLSYQLSLTYNSHLWHFDQPFSNQPELIVASPLPEDNAGLGWRLSLGQLYKPGDTDNKDDSGTWMYRSADGSNHHFWDSLHAVTSATATTQYTNDGSYIRLSTVGETKLVEFPDGTVQTFSQLQPGGSWDPSANSGKWYLSSISDLFGNTISIGYSSSSQYDEIWTISDPARSTIVYFAGTLQRVELEAVGGAALSYSFAYAPLEVARPIGDTGTEGATLTHPNGSISAQGLIAVTPSLGNGYKMTIGNTAAYESMSRVTSGALTRLVLPTLGAVGWVYNSIEFGHLHDHHSPAIAFPTGVITRSTYDANSGLLATWTYDRVLSQVSYCPSPFCANCTSGRARQLTTFITDPVAPDGATKTTISYFSNYEFIDDPDGDTCAHDGWLTAEHGLPFTRYKTDAELSNKGRFLSSEIRTGVTPVNIVWDGVGQVPKTCTACGAPLRETYVSYRLDPGASNNGVESFDYNASLSSTATYFLDDNHCNSSGGTGTDPCFTATNYRKPDDYGHYKQTSSEGNLLGTGNFRTTFTNYNAAPGTSWLLTPFTEQCTIDETAARSGEVSACNDLVPAVVDSTHSGPFITKTQFDANGAVTARRTLRKGDNSLDLADLLSTFSYDSHGNISSEQYYGGDMQALDGSGTFGAPTPSQYSYQISHVPSYTQASGQDPGGALIGDKATYTNGVVVSDQTYDRWTGAVTHVRDVSGLDTRYDYDQLGRVTGLNPPGMTPTIYTYPPASVSGSVFTPAKVTAITDASASGIGKVSKEYQYDPFGRLWRQKSLLPDDTWNIVQTDFDVLGRKMAVSQPERLTVAESSFVPSHKTTFSSYDAFGRAQVVQSPDSSTTRFTFVGVRSVTTTLNVHTAAGDTDVDTTELHDGQNRLISLTEPNGTITTYAYDSADHLTSVTMPGENNITQHRYFNYDGRGFLLSEQHPELGINGDGTTAYGGYDARGHAHSKLIGSSGGIYDLRLTYDAAERLRQITDAGTSHPLKTFTFGETIGAADYGKLLTAMRSNRTGAPLSGDVVTTETYKYENAFGRPSERDTEVKSGTTTTIQSFKQLFTYDTLGGITAPGYLTCLTPVSCTIPTLITATNVYTNGFLTSVPGFGTLSYNGNGTLGQVAHAGNVGVNVFDAITPDANGMPRPQSIDYSGWSAPACSPPAAPSLTAASSACPGSTSNSASVTPVSGVSYAWSISGSGAQITSGNTGTSITYNAGTGPTVTLTVTASACSASASTNANVAVASPTATVSNTSTSNVIQAVLTGTAPWSITWSDNVTQSNIASSPVTRTVSPGVYSVTAVSDHNCSGTSSGTATVLATPQILSARTLDADSTSVHVTWATVPNATSYSVQRTYCLSCSWGTVFAGNALVFDDHPAVNASQLTYLYRIVALANGTQSLPSSTDFATTATNLFVEPIVGGVTPIRGSHVRELRLAIDAVRACAGLPAYTTAFIGEGWPANYGPPTGQLIRAVDVGAMRRALDDAMSLLNGSHIVRTNPSGHVLANDFNQLREGVR